MCKDSSVCFSCGFSVVFLFSGHACFVFPPQKDSNDSVAWQSAHLSTRKAATRRLPSARRAPSSASGARAPARSGSPPGAGRSSAPSGRSPPHFAPSSLPLDSSTRQLAEARICQNLITQVFAKSSQIFASRKKYFFASKIAFFSTISFL